MLHMWNRINSISSLDGYEPKSKKHTAIFICAGIIAFLLVAIGLFQTVLVFGFAEGRRTPTLIMGPIFMGIGFLIIISEVEICVRQRKARKIAEAQAAIIQEEAQKEPPSCSDDNEYFCKSQFPDESPDVGILLRADQLEKILNAPYGEIKKNDGQQLFLTVPLVSTQDINPNLTPSYQAKIPDLALFPVKSNEEYDSDFSQSSTVSPKEENEENTKKEEVEQEECAEDKNQTTKVEEKKPKMDD